MTEVLDPIASLSTLDVRSVPRAAKKKGGDLTERIARAAAAAPAPPPPVVARTAPAEPPPRAEEIVVYWERVRRGRKLPPLADIDCALIARGWPDSLIVLFESDLGAMPRISRLGPADGAIEYTPMVTDWILSRARHAAKRGTRLDEVCSFYLGSENPRYRLFLLPLEGNGTGGGVLCHLCRAH